MGAAAFQENKTLATENKDKSKANMFKEKLDGKDVGPFFHFEGPDGKM
jgi:hypothetical protein